MKLLIRSLLLATAALLASVTIALAAMPKLGGTYVGSTQKNHTIRITINKKPYKKGVYKGTFQYCGLRIVVFVVHGRFGARRMQPSIGVPVTEFRAYGSFSSPQSAHGRIDLDFDSNCQGQPGNWTATLQ